MGCSLMMRDWISQVSTGHQCVLCHTCLWPALFQSCKKWEHECLWCFLLLWLTSEFLENQEEERCVNLMSWCDPAERAFSSRIQSTGSRCRISWFRVTGLIVMLRSYFKERCFLFFISGCLITAELIKAAGNQ